MRNLVAAPYERSGNNRTERLAWLHKVGTFTEPVLRGREGGPLIDTGCCARGARQAERCTEGRAAWERMEAAR